MHRKSGIMVFLTGVVAVLVGFSFALARECSVLCEQVQILQVQLEQTQKTAIKMQVRLEQTQETVTKMQVQLEQTQKTINRYQSLSDYTGLPIGTISLIFYISDYYGFAPEILLGLIQTESDFNPNSTNRNKNGTYDRGLGQLNDGTSPWLWEKNFDVPYDRDLLYDPTINILLTAWYLDYLLERNGGDLHKTFTAYNRGQKGMSRLSSPVTDYSKKTVRNSQKIKKALTL